MARQIQASKTHISTSLTHSILKSVDTVGSMVVSATFVCRFHPYADEMLTKVGEYLTSPGGGISTFRILQPCCPPVRYSIQQTLAYTQVSLSPADGECYQPISTFAYALPAGLHASHSRAACLSTIYFGQPPISRTFPLAT